MTLSTDTYWDVDGTPLQTYAYNVRTLSGASGVPGFKGDNVDVAYRPGKVHRAKTLDAKTITLQMWVQGNDVDGNRTSRGQKREFEKNWRALRQLFWRDDSATVTLTKRWKDPDSGAVLTASAVAELVGNMDPTMGGDAHAAFSVDLLLLDGLYYGAVQTTTLPLNTVTTITNPGDARTFHMSIEFDGQLDTPTLTNQTPSPHNWVKVGSAIAAGDKITLDVPGMSAVRGSDSANMIGAVTRSGARQWFNLLRGTNQVQLTANSGSGQAVLRWQPAYF